MGRKSMVSKDPKLATAIRAGAERGLNAKQIADGMCAAGLKIGYMTVRKWLEANGFDASVRRNANRTRDAEPPAAHRTESETIAKLEADAEAVQAEGTVAEIRERYETARRLVTLAMADVQTALETKSTDAHPANRLQKLSNIEATYAKTLVAIEPKADLEVNRLEALGEAARQQLLERARAAAKGTP